MTINGVLFCDKCTSYVSDGIEGVENVMCENCAKETYGSAYLNYVENTAEEVDLDEMDEEDEQ